MMEFQTRFNVTTNMTISCIFLMYHYIFSEHNTNNGQWPQHMWGYSAGLPSIRSSWWFNPAGCFHKRTYPQIIIHFRGHHPAIGIIPVMDWDSWDGLVQLVFIHFWDFPYKYLHHPTAFLGDLGIWRKLIHRAGVSEKKMSEKYESASVRMIRNPLHIYKYIYIYIYTYINIYMEVSINGGFQRFICYLLEDLYSTHTPSKYTYS